MNVKDIRSLFIYILKNLSLSVIESRRNSPGGESRAQVFLRGLKGCETVCFGGTLLTRVGTGVPDEQAQCAR